MEALNAFCWQYIFFGGCVLGNLFILDVLYIFWWMLCVQCRRHIYFSRRLIFLWWRRLKYFLVWARFLWLRCFSSEIIFSAIISVLNWFLIIAYLFFWWQVLLVLVLFFKIDNSTYWHTKMRKTHYLPFGAGNIDIIKPGVRSDNSVTVGQF